MKPIWFPLSYALWIGVASYVVWLNRGYWRNRDWIETLFPGFFGIVILGMFLAALIAGSFGISSVLGERADLDWHQCWRANLVSMRNADGVSGSIRGGIFVLSGQTDSREVYYYYTTKGVDHYKAHRWEPNSDTTIIEVDGSDAYVVQFDTVFHHSWMEWFGTTNDRLRMDFHIPRGSLVHQFSLK